MTGIFGWPKSSMNTRTNTHGWICYEGNCGLKSLLGHRRQRSPGINVLNDQYTQSERFYRRVLFTIIVPFAMLVCYNQLKSWLSPHRSLLRLGVFLITGSSNQKYIFENVRYAALVNALTLVVPPSAAENAVG